MPIAKPQPGEYAPYTIDYISLVPDTDIVQQLESSGAALEALYRSIPVDTLTTAHKAGEWTPLDILAHIIDTERIFQYRALRIARGDMTDLPGFEQDDYAITAKANERTLDDLLDEFRTVRAASLSLIRSLPESTHTIQGTANKNPLSVRAAIYIIAGHPLYHVNSLNENYL